MTMTQQPHRTPPAESPCVLIVDDSEDDRAEARSALRQGSSRRWKLIEADSGRRAIARLAEGIARGDGLPDCIVVDYHLSDMTAVDFLARLRDEATLPGGTRVPVVVLTGSAGVDVNRQIIRAGAQDFVGKDWLTPESLTRTVENAIERQAMAIELANREAALVVSERRLREFVEAMPVLVGLVEPDGTLRSSNAGPPHLGGAVSRDHLVGRPLWALDWWSHDAAAPGRVRDAFADAIAPPTPGGQGHGSGGEHIVRYDETLRVADGGQILVDLVLRPVRENGELAFVVFSAIDVTQRRRAEEDREHLLQSERAARGDAERANRLKDEFLATLSHELRTPLNAILGWAQMLRVGKLAGDSVRRGLETIERNAKVQAQLIEDLLDMSRILSGKLRLEATLLSLADIVDASMATVIPAAEAKGVTLTKTLDVQRVTVRGDPARLQQVVWNLLSNAVKFTPKGGRVDVRLSHAGSEVVVDVVDSGQGIAPEFVEHVFERFRQADATTTRAHGGLGLGLAIVKHLVEAHGGRIEARSDGVGRGATFRVALPAVDAFDLSSPAPAASAPHDAAAATGAAAAAVIDEAVRSTLDAIDLRGIRVLNVDDDADAREVVQRVLAECGATVETVTSVDEAERALSAGPPFDVLVCDIGMPGRDGFELIRWLRQREAAQAAGASRPRLPAIALTAFARSEDRRRILRDGFNFHLTKPAEPAELCSVVASLVGRFAS